MTIDRDNELGRQIQSIMTMVRADGLHDYSSRNGLEWTSLCGLNVGVDDIGNIIIHSHNLDLRINKIQQVNDNQGPHTNSMLSVEFRRGTASTLAAWQVELARFRTATMRVPA